MGGNAHWPDQRILMYRPTRLDELLPATISTGLWRTNASVLMRVNQSGRHIAAIASSEGCLVRGNCSGATSRASDRQVMLVSAKRRFPSECLTGLSGSESDRPRCGAAGRPEAANLAGQPVGGILAQCDLFGIRSTSHWTGAAIIVQFPRTKTCIVTRSRTSTRPMPFSLAG
jgi:hypothetical protein